MDIDRVKVEKAKELLLLMIQGKDPINKTDISSDNFVADVRMKRMFLYVADILDFVLRQKDRNSPAPNEFMITEEEKQKVVFPEGKIGVNAFCKCINEVIDLNRSKKINGALLNRHLKYLGILSEYKTKSGKTKTVCNSKSTRYGFETEERIFNNIPYQQVVINDEGKKYLLENLDEILKSKPEEN